MCACAWAAPFPLLPHLCPSRSLSLSVEFFFSFFCRVPLRSFFSLSECVCAPPRRVLFTAAVASFVSAFIWSFVCCR